ncbi:MAG: hypothetical protein FH762_19695 [Firmicutes bacterium]|nr:hypothetical protein [Bacillota bacterium]
MSVKVKEEFNYVPKIAKAIEYLGSHHLEIGIFGEDDSELLMIARVQEYGVEIDVTEKMRNYLHSIGLHLKKDTDKITIPERSFMRAGFDTKKKDFQKKGEYIIKSVISLETTPKAGLDILGNYIAGQIQEYLTKLKSPANHPFTIEQKGSNNPLIDEENLRDKITYKIVSG